MSKHQAGTFDDRQFRAAQRSFDRALQYAAASSKFGSVTGGDPEAFAGRIAEINDAYNAMVFWSNRARTPAGAHV